MPRRCAPCESDRRIARSARKIAGRDIEQDRPDNVDEEWLVWHLAGSDAALEKIRKCIDERDLAFLTNKVMHRNEAARLCGGHSARVFEGVLQIVFVNLVI